MENKNKPLDINRFLEEENFENDSREDNTEDKIEEPEKKSNTASTLTIWAVVLVIALIAIVNNMPPNKNNSEAQIKCGASAQKAYELFKEKNSGENFPEIDGTRDNKKDESATIDYKFNYKDDLGLCFVEYIVSMQATTIDTNEPIQGTSKIVSSLIVDITKQQTLAGFAITSYPTGSQKIIGCMAQTPGHYDDLNQKPIKDLLSPTQCSSESEFDSLVSDRFGIR